jgi:hypothetical protein
MNYSGCIWEVYVNQFKKCLYVGVLAVYLAACSKTGFSSNKTDVLAGTAVLGSPQDATSEYGGANTGNNGSGNLFQDLIGNIGKPPREYPNEPAYIGTPGNSETTVSRVCSDSQSKSSTNFKAAVVKGLLMTLKIKDALCTTDMAVINQLVRKTKVSIDDLKAICPGAIPQLGAIEITLSWEKSQFSRGLNILWALNTNKTPEDQVADEYCTKRVSPLLIHMASDPANPQPVAVSSIDEGVEFDLLGARNNHQKVRIGWLTNHDYRFLVLPNENGQVNGIDEMFGDNTSGPDGRFADNGYAALAKYDGKTVDGRFQVATADGFIDRRDPIFRRLRLWNDLNLDGKAARGELRSLASEGLSYIDLNYSSDFAEEDAYGNETKMKSVVGYENGSMDLIFDLWFAYSE